MNLYEKLSAITTELSAVAKNLIVGEGRNQYKATGEADVLAAIKPLEAKHRVYSFPAVRRIIDSDIMNTETTDYKGNPKVVTKHYLRLETIYRFVDIDKPEDFIEITTYGDGIDSQDKAPGKAMTYGDKYALLKAYKIITGEDPDQQYSEDEVSKRSGKKHAAERVTINEKEAAMLHAELARTGIGRKGLLTSYGVTDESQLTLKDFADAMNKLKEKPTKKEETNE